MPNNEEHCADSYRRYGYRFKEIHRWMDEPCTIVGKSHRKFRHDPNSTPKKAEQIFWNEVPSQYRQFIRDVVLDHIRIDKNYSKYGTIDTQLSKEFEDAGFKAQLIVFLLIMLSLFLSFLTISITHDLVLGIVMFFVYWLAISFVLVLSNIFTKLENEALTNYTILALKYIGYVAVILVLILIYALLTSSSKKSKSKFPRPPKREYPYQAKARRRKAYYSNRRR
jgi:hypothetical protein